MVRSSVRDAYLLYSRIQLSFGRPSSAITVLRRALEIMPEDVLLLSLLMQAKLRAGASAIELNSCKRRLLACKRKIHLDDARQYVVDTALAYYEIFVGDVETGERYLARVLASGKAPCDAILLRGERLIAQGRLLQAREQLTRAMLYAPRNPRAALILARSYLMDSKDRNPEWAFSLAETSCKLSGWMNAEALLVLVDSLRLLGEHDKAELFLLRAKKLPSYRELQRGHVALDWAVLDEEKLSNS
jgi:tetratricopeptide (TPR) repeat protein